MWYRFKKQKRINIALPNHALLMTSSQNARNFTNFASLPSGNIDVHYMKILDEIKMKT